MVAVAAVAAAGGGAARGDRLVVSCPIKQLGESFGFGVRTVGDGVFVVTGYGNTTLVASLSPQRRQLVARCTSARPVRADLRGLAGPWPRRLPNVTATVLCSFASMPARVTLSFARMRDRKGRVHGDSMIVASSGRPLVRVTATPSGGGVWLDPTNCFRGVSPT